MSALNVSRRVAAMTLGFVFGASGALLGQVKTNVPDQPGPREPSPALGPAASGEAGVPCRRGRAETRTVTTPCNTNSLRPSPVGC
jgi:hypothetical protein